MKKLALVIVAIAFSSGVSAQVENNTKQSDLKGPEYKNYRHWLDKSAPIKIYSQNIVKPLEGPMYKNQQQWKNTPKENLVEVNIGSNKRQKLTGPEYKNQSHWGKNFR